MPSTTLRPPDQEMVPLAQLVEEDLGHPVVLENDVNALAVWELYSGRDEGDLCVVSVFEEGIGGGLVLDGAVRRGKHGMTMEIGHLHVRDVAKGERSDAGFNAPCECGEYGHLDAVAAPARLAAELRTDDWRAAALGADLGPRTVEVFETGGSALGLALAGLATLADPGRLVLYMPTELADAPSGTPGEKYRTAVGRVMAQGYFSADRVDDLEIRPLDRDSSSILGARAAGLCLLHAFIEYAHGRDGSGSRRAHRA